jgi:hypothetical protein
MNGLAARQRILTRSIELAWLVDNLGGRRVPCAQPREGHAARYMIIAPMA